MLNKLNNGEILLSEYLAYSEEYWWKSINLKEDIKMLGNDKKHELDKAYEEFNDIFWGSGAKHPM